MVTEAIVETCGQVLALDSGPNGHSAVLTKVKLVVARALGALQRLVEDAGAHAHACFHRIAAFEHAQPRDRVVDLPFDLHSIRGLRTVETDATEADEMFLCVRANCKRN